MSTVENAAVNLTTYDECAFVPNYPMALRGSPPRSKVILVHSCMPRFDPAVFYVLYSLSSLRAGMVGAHIFHDLLNLFPS